MKEDKPAYAPGKANDVTRGKKRERFKKSPDLMPPSSSSYSVATPNLIWSERLAQPIPKKPNQEFNEMAPPGLRLKQKQSKGTRIIVSRAAHPRRITNGPPLPSRHPFPTVWDSAPFLGSRPTHSPQTVPRPSCWDSAPYPGLQPVGAPQPLLPSASWDSVPYRGSRAICEPKPVPLAATSESAPFHAPLSKASPASNQGPQPFDAPQSVPTSAFRDSGPYSGPQPNPAPQFVPLHNQGAGTNNQSSNFESNPSMYARLRDSESYSRLGAVNPNRNVESFSSEVGGTNSTPFDDFSKKKPKELKPHNEDKRVSIRFEIGSIVKPATVPVHLFNALAYLKMKLRKMCKKDRKLSKLIDSNFILRQYDPTFDEFTDIDSSIKVMKEGETIKVVSSDNQFPFEEQISRQRFTDASREAMYRSKNFMESARSESLSHSPSHDYKGRKSKDGGDFTQKSISENLGDKEEFIARYLAKAFQEQVKDNPDMDTDELAEKVFWKILEKGHFPLPSSSTLNELQNLTQKMENKYGGNSGVTRDGRRSSPPSVKSFEERRDSFLKTETDADTFRGMATEKSLLMKNTTGQALRTPSKDDANVQNSERKSDVVMENVRNKSKSRWSSDTDHSLPERTVMENVRKKFKSRWSSDVDHSLPERTSRNTKSSYDHCFRDGASQDTKCSSTDMLTSVVQNSLGSSQGLETSGNKPLCPDLLVRRVGKKYGKTINNAVAEERQDLQLNAGNKAAKSNPDLFPSKTKDPKVISKAQSKPYNTTSKPSTKSSVLPGTSLLKDDGGQNKDTTDRSIEKRNKPELMEQGTPKMATEAVYGKRGRQSEDDIETDQVFWKKMMNLELQASFYNPEENYDCEKYVDYAMTLNNDPMDILSLKQLPHPTKFTQYSMTLEDSTYYYFNVCQPLLSDRESPCHWASMIIEQAKRYAAIHTLYALENIPGSRKSVDPPFRKDKSVGKVLYVFDAIGPDRYRELERDLQHGLNVNDASRVHHVSRRMVLAVHQKIYEQHNV